MYAIAARTLAVFESSIGRRLNWGFLAHELYLVPHAMAEANAYYADDVRAVLFGYMPATARDAGRVAGRVAGTAHRAVGTAGSRRRLHLPAFHEGLANIVALLSVFSMSEVVQSLLGQADLEGRIAERTRLVVRSWTENPAAPADATGPGGTALRAGLDRGRAFPGALSQAIAASRRGLRSDVRELALAQLANQAAIDRLNAWSQAGAGVYVNYGQPLALDAVVPGVQVRVIGPPTVAQHPAVAKERSTSPEYWQLYQGLTATGAFDPDAGTQTAADARLVGPERWLVERLQAPQLRSLLRIVTRP
jgi:hypothetical protein